MTIDLHLPLITAHNTYHSSFKKVAGLFSSFLEVLAEPKGEAVGKTAFFLFCSETPVLVEIVLSILSGRGEYLREREVGEEERFPLAGIEQMLAGHHQTHRDTNLVIWIAHIQRGASESHIRAVLAAPF